MIFHGRGRSTTSANGSNKSQSSASSSGKSREHQGGVSLCEDTERHEHLDGVPLTDNKEHEGGGVSLREFNNDPSNNNKHGGVNPGTNNSFAPASSSVGTSRFSQRQKATLVSNHSIENVQSNHIPARPYGLKSSMPPCAYNGFNKGLGYRGSFAGQYASTQCQPTRLAQSNSTPTLPFITSPPQPSMANSGSMNTVVSAPQMGGTRAAQLVQPDNAYAIPYGTHVTHQDSGNVYYSNAVIQSPAGFSHVTPQSYGPVYSNNAGPGPGCNGSYGHVTHDSYQAGPNNGVVTAQGSYIDHSNVGAPHGDHQVDYNNCMMIQESNMGFPHDSHLVHGSSTGMAILNNVAAPIPSHAGKQIKYFVNPHTGDKMTLDGTVWTPHGEKKDLFAESSIYNQTEPRNFAPRPMGSPIMFPPPPTFNLVAGANSQAPEIVSNEAIFDPFSSPTSSATNAANQVAFSQADSQELTCSEPTEGKGRLSREWGLLRNKLAMLRALGSAGLQNLISGDQGIPSESVLLRLDNFPFIESSSQSMPATWGVIKISNIPFGTTRAEIIAFLGRNSKIVNDAQEGIHIIMERVTSKTGDAFVEFSSQHAANRAMERYREAIRKHRHPRLGDRPVDMTMSSQKELMEVLFPWCHGVKFNHGRAEMLPFDEKNPWNVFRGFVTEEEMALVIKHVEVPSRSPYSKDCPQRPYECMISTLKKLPWYRSDVITLKQRQILFDTTCRLIEILYHLIQKGDQKGDRSTNNRHEENVLNEQLYKRLVNAAMLCPGFSVLQKDNIAYIAGLTGPRIAQFNMPPFAECWSHLYNLCPRPGVPVDVLEWYIALIREETVRFVGTLPEDEQAAIKERAQDDSLYFGYMWYEIQLPQGKGLADMTLRDVAKKELEAIKRALRRAATVAHSPRAIEGASQHLDHRQVI